MKLGDDFRFLLSKIKPQPLWIQGKGHLAVIQTATEGKKPDPQKLAATAQVGLF
jgi:hypothetical protein